MARGKLASDPRVTVAGAGPSLQAKQLLLQSLQTSWQDLRRTTSASTAWYRANSCGPAFVSVDIDAEEWEPQAISALRASFGVVVVAEVQGLRLVTEDVKAMLAAVGQCVEPCVPLLVVGIKGEAHATLQSHAFLEALGGTGSFGSRPVRVEVVNVHKRSHSLEESLEWLLGAIAMGYDAIAAVLGTTGSGPPSNEFGNGSFRVSRTSSSSKLGRTDSKNGSRGGSSRRSRRHSLAAGLWIRSDALAGSEGAEDEPGLRRLNSFESKLAGPTWQRAGSRRLEKGRSAGESEEEGPPLFRPDAQPQKLPRRGAGAPLGPVPASPPTPELALTAPPRPPPPFSLGEEPAGHKRSPPSPARAAPGSPPPLGASPDLRPRRASHGASAQSSPSLIGDTEIPQTPALNAHPARAGPPSPFALLHADERHSPSAGRHSPSATPYQAFFPPTSRHPAAPPPPTPLHIAMAAPAAPPALHGFAPLPSPQPAAAPPPPHPAPLQPSPTAHQAAAARQASAPPPPAPPQTAPPPHAPQQAALPQPAPHQAPAPPSAPVQAPPPAPVQAPQAVAPPPAARQAPAPPSPLQRAADPPATAPHYAPAPLPASQPAAAHARAPPPAHQHADRHDPAPLPAAQPVASPQAATHHASDPLAARQQALVPPPAPQPASGPPPAPQQAAALPPAAHEASAPPPAPQLVPPPPPPHHPAPAPPPAEQQATVPPPAPAPHQAHPRPSPVPEEASAPPPAPLHATVSPPAPLHATVSPPAPQQAPGRPASRSGLAAVHAQSAGGLSPTDAAVGGVRRGSDGEPPRAHAAGSRRSSLATSEPPRAHAAGSRRSSLAGGEGVRRGSIAGSEASRRGSIAGEGAGGRRGSASQPGEELDILTMLAEHSRQRRMSNASSPGDTANNSVRRGSVWNPAAAPGGGPPPPPSSSLRRESSSIQKSPARLGGSSPSDARRGVAGSAGASPSDARRGTIQGPAGPAGSSPTDVRRGSTWTPAPAGSSPTDGRRASALPGGPASPGGSVHGPDSSRVSNRRMWPAAGSRSASRSASFRVGGLLGTGVAEGELARPASPLLVEVLARSSSPSAVGGVRSRPASFHSLAPAPAAPLLSAAPVPSPRRPASAAALPTQPAAAAAPAARRPSSLAALVKPVDMSGPALLAAIVSAGGEGGTRPISLASLGPSAAAAAAAGPAPSPRRAVSPASLAPSAAAAAAASPSPRRAVSPASLAPSAAGPGASPVRPASGASPAPQSGPAPSPRRAASPASLAGPVDLSGPALLTAIVHSARGEGPASRLSSSRRRPSSAVHAPVDLVSPPASHLRDDLSDDGSGVGLSISRAPRAATPTTVTAGPARRPRFPPAAVPRQQSMPAQTPRALVTGPTPDFGSPASEAAGDRRPPLAQRAAAAAEAARGEVLAAFGAGESPVRPAAELSGGSWADGTPARALGALEPPPPPMPPAALPPAAQAPAAAASVAPAAPIETVSAAPVAPLLAEAAARASARAETVRSAAAVAAPPAAHPPPPAADASPHGSAAPARVAEPVAPVRAEAPAPARAEAAAPSRVEAALERAPVAAPAAAAKAATAAAAPARVATAAPVRAEAEVAPERAPAVRAAAAQAAPAAAPVQAAPAQAEAAAPARPQAAPAAAPVQAAPARAEAAAPARPQAAPAAPAGHVASGHRPTLDPPAPPPLPPPIPKPRPARPSAPPTLPPPPTPQPRAPVPTLSSPPSVLSRASSVAPSTPSPPSNPPSPPAPPRPASAAVSSSGGSSLGPPSPESPVGRVSVLDERTVRIAPASSVELDVLAGPSSLVHKLRVTVRPGGAVDVALLPFALANGDAEGGAGEKPARAPRLRPSSAAPSTRSAAGAALALALERRRGPPGSPPSPGREERYVAWVAGPASAGAARPASAGPARPRPLVSAEPLDEWASSGEGGHESREDRARRLGRRWRARARALALLKAVRAGLRARAATALQSAARGLLARAALRSLRARHVARLLVGMAPPNPGPKPRPVYTATPLVRAELAGGPAPPPPLRC